MKIKIEKEEQEAEILSIKKLNWWKRWDMNDYEAIVLVDAHIHTVRFWSGIGLFDLQRKVSRL